MNSKASAINGGTVKVGDFYFNRMGFGAMRITGDGIWGEPKDRESAKQVLQRAVALDINLIDTADAYGPEVSENLIRESLYPYEGIVIATKGGLTRSGPFEWKPDCSPEHLRKACDESLTRLGVDQIDLYQLHTVDSNVPFEESYRTMLDLQREGKVRHLGLSNIEPEHFKLATEMGEFVSVQNNYNVFNREHEDVLALCEQNGIAFIPYFPVGGGQSDMQESVLLAIAKKHGVSTHQIALAWLLAHSPVMLPIPGTSSIAHLEENVLATNIQLSPEDMDALDSIAS
jgi:pyridoxine 4-dehydrogenase